MTIRRWRALVRSATKSRLLHTTAWRPPSTMTQILSCWCGIVRATVTGAPTVGVSYCHCSVCRKLTGAPFSFNGLWPSSQVDVAGKESLQGLQTSKHVTRYRYAKHKPVGPLRSAIKWEWAGIIHALLCIQVRPVWSADDGRAGQGHGPAALLVCRSTLHST